MSNKPEDLAKELEREAEALERRSDELGHEIDHARQDWRQKRQDDGVPGAIPLADQDTAEGASEDEKPPAKRDPDDDL